MRKFLLILLFVLFPSILSASSLYWKSNISGGLAGYMDAISGSGLNDGDVCVVVSGTNFYFYILDVDSGLSESSPTVISPDISAGTKRWVLISYNGEYIQADTIDDDSLDFTDITLVDFTNDAGFLTSQTSHADVVQDGDFASQGIMLRGASSGVYSILTDSSANWNTAYGWGNHASAGYLTSEVDGSITNEIEVVDETFNATNFNGGTASGVSQDDFYDLWHAIDTDDDLDFDVMDATVWATKLDTSAAFTESAFTTKIGAAYDTEAEQLALFTDALERGTEGETMLSLAENATPDISNAGTGIASRLWQSANTGSTTITDFDDGDNHSEFTEGDWFTLRVDDANTVINFTTDSNIRRGDGSGLDFTGSADYPYVLEFKYTGTWWQCTNLPPGLTSPTSYASSTFGDATIVTDADGLTMTAALMHNGKVIATGAGVINALNIDATANFVVTSTTADNVDVNPDDTDAFTYCDSDSCATGSAGEALRLTNIGDVASCTYSGAANGIHCNVSDGVAEETP